MRGGEERRKRGGEEYRAEPIRGEDRRVEERRRDSVSWPRGTVSQLAGFQ